MVETKIAYKTEKPRQLGTIFLKCWIANAQRLELKTWFLLGKLLFFIKS